MRKNTALPDQAARHAIENDLDKNMLVEASAGSGKTESLARRMVAGIVQGTYSTDHMAAVTFTRKAAAELRGRCQEVLEKRLKDEQDATRRARIEDALSHLERLFVGTIHAFCAHLIRERPVEAGVAPGFTELEEEQNTSLRRRAWREYIDIARAQGSAELRELLEAGLAPHDLHDAFATVCNFADAEFPTGDAPKPDTRTGRQGFETFRRALEQHLPKVIPPEAACDLQQAGQQMRDFVGHADLDSPRELAELLARWEKTPKMTQKHWPGTLKETKALKATLDPLILEFQQATVQPFLAAWRQYVYRLAMTLILKGRLHFAQARQAALTLNYEDLLQTAALLLRSNPQVRETLQQKYRWIFVDEFQDTDPIQAEVMLLLAAVRGASGSWTDVDLRPGSLFVVGDPKQSIFRFRRADIDTYQRVRKRIEQTGGTVVSLTASFRSIPVLCDWANTTFGGIFPKESTPQQPAFHGLHAVKEAPKTHGGVFVLDIPDSVKEGHIPLVEAELIAGHIQAAIEAEGRSPGDFLVITRKKRQLSRYAAALENLRIPVEVSGASALMGSRLVAALTLLLRVLSDPDDGPAVIGVLRGPLFGLSDEALYQHRAAGLPFLFTVPFDEPRSNAVVEALSVMRTMYGWIRTLPVSAAVEQILETTGLMAYAAIMSPGAAEAAALQQAVDLIREMNVSGGSLADTVAMLEEELSAGQVETVPLEPGQRNVVRIMNLHKAKGLEAPVVFLADPLGGVKQSAKVRILRNGTTVIGYLQLTKPNGPHRHTVIGEPADWGTHREEELQYLVAEEERLLYVAATRAKELLVIGRWAKSGGQGSRPWSPLDPNLAQAQTLPSLKPRQAASTSREQLNVSGRSSAAQKRDQRQTKMKQCSWQIDSVTSSTHHGGGTQVSEDEQRADAGPAWGTLIHALLEHAMRHPEMDHDHVRQLAIWHSRDNEDLVKLVDLAITTVEAVRTSAFWQQVQGAAERLVEVPFCVNLTNGPTPRLMSGIVDLLYRTEQGWHLVDYKTDQLSIDELGIRYRAQLRQYGTHWATIVGEPVAYAGIYGVRHRLLSPNLL